MDLFIRELDNELFARKLNPTKGGGNKGGPNKPPNLPRRGLDEEMLFARKLNPTNKGGKKGGPNKPPNLPRRGLEHDAYSLWERMDLDELE